MRYKNEILALVLIAGVFVSPFVIRAEENGESVVAAVLSAAISAPANNTRIQTGVATTFTASATGGQPPYAYVWNFGDGTEAFGQSYEKVYESVGTKAVTLTVTDFSGARATSQITVTVNPPTLPPPPDSLTISNIRVTDVTHESAVIHWTTNRAASSRVIYDMVSRPSIVDQTAPNFGYAFSTDTFNSTAPVTEHAVTVTGLAPSTTYYFRVISQ